MRVNEPRLCAAGVVLRGWLVAQKRTQRWLVGELGVNRGVLWQWMTGQRAPHLNNAAQIERITGIPAAMWATRDDLRPVPAPRSSRRVGVEARA